MDVYAERVASVSGRNFDGTPRDLCFPTPTTTLGGIVGRPMDRHSRIASQVHGFDRVRHGADRELPAGDLDLGAADARRTILAERRHCEVLPRGHQLTNAVRKFREVRFELGPRRQLDRENSMLAVDPR